jgi:uncharacterized protein
MDLYWAVRLLTDQKKELEKIDLGSLCPRREESLLEIDSSLAQVVIGVRRSGKSMLCLKTLLQSGKKFGYVDFDDENLENLERSDLNVILEAAYMVYGDFDYLFLDEVQNVDGWHLFVNRLLRQKMHIVLTGSNAKLLSSDLATHLTGRYNEITLYPFSFEEYCKIKGLDTKDLSTKNQAFVKLAFDGYLRKGGFPEALNLKNQRGYITSLIEAIIKKDIAKRFKVRYVEALEKMANYLMDNFCREVVYKTLAGLFGFGSDHTAENYYSYLKQAFLLQGINKFSYKSAERIRGEKSYVVDVAFLSDRENTLTTENLGYRMENIVYIELLRRYRNQGMDIYFHKNGYEIDFMVVDRTRIAELIQVCYSMDSEKTRKRELGGLAKGHAQFKCESLTLITLNERGEEVYDGARIRKKTVVDWLLGND